MHFTIMNLNTRSRFLTERDKCILTTLVFILFGLLQNTIVARVWTQS